MSAEVHLLDRAAGVLLGLACGDALGVPYEFAPRLAGDEQPTMKGGGLGDLAPGEWSDDTAMAVAVAEGLLASAALEDRVEAVAERFLAWHATNPPDIGVQTRAVLDGARRRLHAGESSAAAAMRAEATGYAAAHSRAAGNGALMRTAPIALAHLDDRPGCAAAARAIAELTHADPLAGDACVLWTEAIRLVITHHSLVVTLGLDLLPETRRTQWERWLSPSSLREPEQFNPNGFTVTALQAAHGVAVRSVLDGQSVADALARAVRIGDDTDTVAAIAGSQLGGYHGVTRLPGPWLSAVHGWPGLRMGDLAELAVRLVGDTEPGELVYDDGSPIPPAVEPHPHDPGVLIGNTVPPEVTAVVDLRVPGVIRRQFDDVEVVACWWFAGRELLDQGPFLNHAAQAVHRLRSTGHTVLIHFPVVNEWQVAVALTYATQLGHDLHESWHAMADIWPWVGSWHALYYSVRDIDGWQDSV